MLKEARSASGVSRVVSSTIVSEMPSTPRWKEELIALYQMHFLLELEPGSIRVETDPQHERQHQRDEAEDESRPTDQVFLIVWQQHHDHRRQHRSE